MATRLPFPPHDLARDLISASTISGLWLVPVEEDSMFAADLAPHAQRLGGPGAAESTTRGTLHRRWMAIRHALTGFNDSAMGKEVIQREDEAAAIYDEALSEMLPPTSRDLIEAQRAEIRLAHDRAVGMLMH